MDGAERRWRTDEKQSALVAKRRRLSVVIVVACLLCLLLTGVRFAAPDAVGVQRATVGKPGELEPGERDLEHVSEFLDRKARRWSFAVVILLCCSRV